MSKQQLITFPDGSSRYVANKWRIGAGIDDRGTIPLLGAEPEPERYPGPTVFVKSPSGNYKENHGIESAEHFERRNYGMQA